MTRSRAKRVKEKMKLLIQATMDETSILGSKGISFMFGLEEDSKWINIIKAAEEGTDQKAMWSPSFLRHVTAYSEAKIQEAEHA